jgi:hypothetical protein
MLGIALIDRLRQRSNANIGSEAITFDAIGQQLEAKSPLLAWQIKDSERERGNRPFRPLTSQKWPQSWCDSGTKSAYSPEAEAKLAITEQQRHVFGPLGVCHRSLHSRYHTQKTNVKSATYASGWGPGFEPGACCQLVG